MPTVRVPVSPKMFRWARERARLTPAALERAFPKLAEWERGEQQPTLKQLEQFARRTLAPVGYFFLAEPPEERLPIPDFRTMRDEVVTRPSANLLETIYTCQRRQSWYRDYAETNGHAPLSFVGSIRSGDDVPETANLIRATFRLDLRELAAERSWEAALTLLMRRVEDAGILVMKNGVVGNNTHRPLDREEFRGFALADPLAPLIFVNAADSKAGQMFTMAHELVHIFANQTALDDASPRRFPRDAMERWCNEVAAELLVPLDVFASAYDASADINLELQRLARHFKVSTLVVLRRMFDAKGLTRAGFWTAYDAEVARLRMHTPSGSGGDFYATETVRVGRRFARALVSSTMEGVTLYRDAFRLLGITKSATFNAFSTQLGVVD